MRVEYCAVSIYIIKKTVLPPSASSGLLPRCTVAEVATYSTLSLSCGDLEWLSVHDILSQAALVLATDDAIVPVLAPVLTP